MEAIGVYDNHECWIGTTPEILRKMLLDSSLFKDETEKRGKYFQGLYLITYGNSGIDEARLLLRDMKEETRTFNGVKCIVITLHGYDQSHIDSLRSIYNISRQSKISAFTSIPSFTLSGEKNVLSDVLIAFHPHQNS